MEEEMEALVVASPPDRTEKEQTGSASEKSDRMESDQTPHAGSSFLRMQENIEEGDTVIVYVNYGSSYPIVVKRGESFHMKYGQLKHEFLIGKKWGSRVTTTAGYIFALRPSSELWTRSLPRRTQILYSPDVATITGLLDARCGSVLCESGTGSGSLSHALALAILPDGHLYTHDIDESRTRKFQQEIKEHGLSSVCTAVVQNVCTDGFFVENACDGVFLDVPCPWEAVAAAAKALSLRRGGRLVSFSPCVEQVKRTVAEMRKQGFVRIETVEIVPQKLMVVDERRQTLADFGTNGERAECATGKAKKRRLDTSEVSTPEKRPLTTISHPATQPTHTGYITAATMLLRI